MKSLWLAGLLLVVALPASAAAPVKPSIVLDQVGPFSIGDEVTFTTSLDEAGYWVLNACYQDRNRVYAQVYKTTEASIFTLGPTAEWSSGGAECEAELYVRRDNGRKHVLADVDYTVEG
jgi:hypothetical protein